MIKKFNNWYFNDNISSKHIKRLWLWIVIFFIVGIIFKLVDASMATWHYVTLINERDNLSVGKANGIPEAIAGWNRFHDGAKDQLVGAVIGWALIVLKLIIYIWSIVSIGKYAFSNEKMPNKKLWFNIIKYMILFIGLFIGEAITIWMTLRNDSDMTPRVVYSFISPAISIVLALILGLMAYKEIQERNAEK